MVTTSASPSEIGDLDGVGLSAALVGASCVGGGCCNRGAAYAFRLDAVDAVRAEHNRSSTVGGLAGPMDNGDHLGISAADISNRCGDGVRVASVDAIYDDYGGSNRAAVYVLLLIADEYAIAEQEISSVTGDRVATSDTGDYLDTSTAAIGDLDGDGLLDAFVGATYDYDGGSSRGAVYVLSGAPMAPSQRSR